MIANNGLSGIETENTIFAFLAAANRSYLGISCELSISKDNKYIVTGCDSLLKYGLLNLDIPSFSYNELKKFALVDRKTGNLNEFVFIPRLEDYLAICKAYGKKYRELDLKNKQKELSNEEIYQLLSDNPMLIKRPLIVDQDYVRTGFHAEEYATHWKTK